MKVLNKNEKELYENIKIEVTNIDCWNIPVPESWKKIRVAKFEDKE